MNSLMKYVKLLVNIMYTLFAFFIVVYVLPKGIKFFMPFVVGWIVSLIANPLVKLLETKMKIMRKYSSVLIIVLVLGVLVGGGYLAVVKIGGQLIAFVEQVPDMYEQIGDNIKNFTDNMSGLYERFPDGMKSYLITLGDSMGETIGTVVSSIGRPTVTASVNFAKNIPAFLIAMIFTILSAYFFLVEREMIIATGNKITPKGIKEKWHLVAGSLKGALGGYIKAQGKIMIIVAFILFIGFLILKIEFAILFALLIAILDALPFFGTGTALVPWAVFKLIAGDYKGAVGLLIIYAVSQLVRQIIQPKIVGDSIGVNPFLSLILMYIGYKLQGVLGMIFAVPVGVVIINLHKGGAFDNIIQMGKSIVEDFNNFRKA